MSWRRPRGEAARRFAERRQREDEAPRLHAVAPTLTTLRLELEAYPEGRAATLSHTRHVVVARAPALFLVPCGDADCAGSHDLTSPLLRALAGLRERTEMEDACNEWDNGVACRYLVRCVAIASYVSPT